VGLFVIGATGFLGTHVRQRAAAAGLDMVTASRSAPVALTSDMRLDLATDGAPRIAALLAEIKPDVVVNCAGAISGPPDALAEANITGPAALVQAMLVAGSPARLIHLGSAAEYGRGEPGVPVDERSATWPVGLYGVTKLAGTRVVEVGRAAGLDAVVLRVFNPVGPGAPPSSLPGRLAALVSQTLASGAPVRVGPLDAVRDFVDARDVADAVLAAATASALPHPVINVGSGRGVPARALVDELLAITGHAGEVHEDTAGSTRSADVPWQEADVTQARQDLSWLPRRTLTTSLTDLWEATS
jgi:nucleoside-diphosphate-sugar epimerase